MDIEVRPCASVEELRDSLNAISHYFGQENELEEAERFARLDRASSACTRRSRATASSAVRAPSRYRTVGARRRARARRGRHGRRCAAHPSPPRRAHRADARAARGLPRARRSRSPTSGPRRGRSTAGSATASPRGSARSSSSRERTRFADAVRAARDGAPGRARRGGAQLPAALRRGASRSVRACSAAARPGGRRAGSSTIRPAAQGGPLNRALLELDGEPAGYALYRVRAGLAARLQQGGRHDPGGRRADSGGNPRALALAARLRLDVRVRRRPAAARPSAVPAARRAAPDCSSRSTTACGCGWSTCRGALAARTYADAEPVVLDVVDAFLPENDGRWRVSADGVERDPGASPICGSTSRSSARCTSAASTSPGSHGRSASRS